jgi:hypothetical protein
MLNADMDLMDELLLPMASTQPALLYQCQAEPANMFSCFPADLAREISKDLPDVKVDFLRASSYGTASESSGNVQVKTTSDLGRWEEYHILLVRGVGTQLCLFEILAAAAAAVQQWLSL